MGISATFFLLAATFGSQEKSYVIGSTVLCAVYLLLLYINGLAGKAKKYIKIILLFLIVCELSVSSFIAIKTNQLTNRDEYPDSYEKIQAVLMSRQPVRHDFYRTEIDEIFTINDPYLYNYQGISFFSSTANKYVTNFMQGFGLPSNGGGNNYFYNEATPLTNAFLNIRYMITFDDFPADKGMYWNYVDQTGDTLLMENRYYLPLGFMVNEDISGYTHGSANPFLSKNDLFRRATGLAGNLFTITDLSNNTLAPASQRQNLATWSYTMPSDGMLYVYCKDEKNDTISVYLNGASLTTVETPPNIYYIAVLGYFSQYDVISFMADKDAIIYTGLLDFDLFEQGYAILASSPLNLTHFSNTKASGNVTALRDGVLYTSIPGKNWNVYVNGSKSELLLIDNAMAAVRLSEGTHNVEFWYFNRSFAAGIIISLVSVAVFLAMIIRQKTRN